MDAWQTSVENRLGSLDTRLGKIEERLGGVETATATLAERVSHLPTKTSLYTTAIAIVLALTAAITFGEQLHKIVAPSPSSASSSPQSTSGLRNS